MAPAARNGKGNPGLGKGMRQGKAALERQGPMATQDAPGVPPARRVHLPMAGDRQPKFEQSLVING
jgi:hypothetical protein